MTAVECLNAVKFAVWNVFRIRGLTTWQRLQLALLKIVAVCGYHYGKYLSIAATTRSSPVIASHEEALEAVRAVNGSVCFDCSLHAEVLLTTAVLIVSYVLQGGQGSTGN